MPSEPRTAETDAEIEHRVSLLLNRLELMAIDPRSLLGHLLLRAAIIARSFRSTTTELVPSDFVIATLTWSIFAESFAPDETLRFDDRDTEPLLAVINRLPYGRAPWVVSVGMGRDQLGRLPGEDFLSDFEWISPSAFSKSLLVESRFPKGLNAASVLARLVQGRDLSDATDLKAARAIVDDSSPFRGAGLPEWQLESRPGELTADIHSYALAVATVLRSAREEFTFALFGRWGSGKSRLVSVLKPLLEKDENFERASGAKLGSTKAGGNYKVVVHDALKYKTPPEAWIFLYKGLVTAALDGRNPIGSRLLALRAAISKGGYWPLVSSLIALSLVAMPLSAKAGLISAVVSLLGGSLVLQMTAVSRRLPKTIAAMFSKHMKLAGDDYKLGMLALIGEDVRALVRAWAREPSATDNAPEAGLSNDITISKMAPMAPADGYGWPVAAISAVSLLWALSLLNLQGFLNLRHLLSIHGPGTGLVHWLSDVSTFQWVIRQFQDAWHWALNAFRREPTNWPDFLWMWGLWLSWNCLAGFTIIAPFFETKNRPDRILLVIDNLDRCTGKEMLDIIQSLRLLLDDPEVSSRLQVMMLTDEDVLNHAISEHYSDLIVDLKKRKSEGEKSSEDEAFRDIVAQEKEKLFSCYLRMADRDDRDTSDLVEMLAGLKNREDKLAAEIRSNEERRKRRAEEQQRLSELERRQASELERLKQAAQPFVPAPLISLDGPSRYQPRLPAQVRASTGIDYIPMNSAEKEKAEEQNKRIAAENSVKAKMSVEERQAPIKKNLESIDAQIAESQATLERFPRPGEAATEQGRYGLEEAKYNFSDADILVLRDLVPAHFDRCGRHPSPRAIKALLFKIRLSRLLLQVSGFKGGPDAGSIKHILDALYVAAMNGNDEANDLAFPISLARQIA